MLPDHTLELLTEAHAEPLLAFELENRAYFARFIADRGDEFFANFPGMLRARLAEQAEGVCKFHVLVDADGAVVGRINLVDLGNGSAELGYRIAEHAAGRGLATAAVREVVRLAATEYGLQQLTAGTARVNVASQKVLRRVGFEEVPVEGASTVGGREQAAFLLRLEGL